MLGRAEFERNLMLFSRFLSLIVNKNVVPEMLDYTDLECLEILGYASIGTFFHILKALRLFNSLILCKGGTRKIEPLFSIFSTGLSKTKNIRILKD